MMVMVIVMPTRKPYGHVSLSQWNLASRIKLATPLSIYRRPIRVGLAGYRGDNEAPRDNIWSQFSGRCRLGAGLSRRHRSRLIGWPSLRAKRCGGQTSTVIMSFEAGRARNYRRPESGLRSSNDASLPGVDVGVVVFVDVANVDLLGASFT